MGSYDGAEICEFVGLYILGRVNGIQNASDRTRKDIIRTFPENFGLKIYITTNLKTVNFLDVTFSLCTGK